MLILSPSILAADFTKLGEQIKETVEAGAEYIHLDVMDGMFVPQISFGMPVIETIRSCTDKVFDVHLMIQDPGRYIETFAKTGADIITVHAEACTHLHRTIQEIHSAGMKAGVALNPATPLAMVEEVLSDVDLVLIMSVNPGFSGQSFITSSTDKVRRLRQMIDRLEHRPLIEVDGGVNGKTAPMLVAAGADVLVSGSYVFGAEDPEAAILSLKSRD